MKFLYFFSNVIAGRNNVNVTACIRLHTKFRSLFEKRWKGDDRCRASRNVRNTLYTFSHFIRSLLQHFMEEESITERCWKVTKITARFVDITDTTRFYFAVFSVYLEVTRPHGLGIVL